MSTSVIETQSMYDVSPQRRFTWVWIAAVVLLAVYVLSHAPVTKIRHVTGGGTGTPVCLVGEGLTVYQPVDWLVSNTVLRYPLIQWADLWGVKYGRKIVLPSGVGVYALDDR